MTPEPTIAIDYSGTTRYRCPFCSHRVLAIPADFRCPVCYLIIRRWEEGPEDFIVRDGDDVRYPPMTMLVEIERR